MKHYLALLIGAALTVGCNKASQEGKAADSGASKAANEVAQEDGTALEGKSGSGQDDIMPGSQFIGTWEQSIQGDGTYLAFSRVLTIERDGEIFLIHEVKEMKTGTEVEDYYGKLQGNFMTTSNSMVLRYISEKDIIQYDRLNGSPKLDFFRIDETS